VIAMFFILAAFQINQIDQGVRYVVGQFKKKPIQPVEEEYEDDEFNEKMQQSTGVEQVTNRWERARRRLHSIRGHQKEHAAEIP
jgi:hypothetical protein